jgi:hypothetical protein
MQVRAVPGQHEAHRVGLNFREAEEAHYDLHFTGHQVGTQPVAGFERDKFENYGARLKLVCGLEVHFNLLRGLHLGASFGQQRPEPHLHQGSLVFSGQIDHLKEVHDSLLDMRDLGPH